MKILSNIFPVVIFLFSIRRDFFLQQRDEKFYIKFMLRWATEK